MPDFPFQFEFDAIQARLDEFVSAVFSSLESEFLILPKGEGFVDYSVFETGYETLKRASSGFTKFTSVSGRRNALRKLPGLIRHLILSFPTSSPLKSSLKPK
jgi:hypothetical protein